ncbi:exodeoxyribonuclease VII large subunit [soil metagenome]
MPTPTDIPLDIELTVSDFVALHNQILEYTMPSVTVVGELSNFKVSKNRWVYFDLKDDNASVRFFGTVYQLSGPLENGMLLKVHGSPRLHPQFGFSITVLSMQPTGEGAIRKAFDLLQAKLTQEGLFDPARKRILPYPPERVGIIASSESAAYADFTKIIAARWFGLDITLADVQVQGEAAPAQIVQAISDLNAMAKPPEVLVITRGGGSADDLWAFNTEQVARAVAASRIPTLVAIGHEVDISLAELAADQRASTPSNAAELLTPDKREVLAQLKAARRTIDRDLAQAVQTSKQVLIQVKQGLQREAEQALVRQKQRLVLRQQMLELLNPTAILRRGYAIVRDITTQQVVRKSEGLVVDQELTVMFQDGSINTKVQ